MSISACEPWESVQHSALVAGATQRLTLICFPFLLPVLVPAPLPAEWAAGLAGLAGLVGLAGGGSWVQ